MAILCCAVNVRKLRKTLEAILLKKISTFCHVSKISRPRFQKLMDPIKKDLYIF